MNANAPHNAIDHTIDGALSALRDAQPRPGLEGRVLTSLEHRTAAPQPKRLHLSAHVALWAASSAAILAIASLIILHHRATPARSTNAVILSEASRTGSPASLLAGAEREAKSKDPERASPATNPEPFSTANLARASAREIHVPPSAVSSRPDLSSRHPERSASAHSRRTPVFENCRVPDASGCGNVSTIAASSTPTDAQALADLHAPSHPAPPLPLTPQEKLFLRMLRYGNATQLAELNPIVREQHAAAEAADFKAFFPDPPPLKQPGDTE